MNLFILLVAEDANILPLDSSSFRMLVFNEFILTRLQNAHQTVKYWSEKRYVNSTLVALCSIKFPLKFYNVV